MIKDPHVEIKSLIDQSTCLGIFGIEGIVFSVLVNQVRADCSTLVKIETFIVDSGHIVLWVHLNEFRFHLFASHEIRFLQAQVDANHFSRHHNRTAWGTNIHVVKVDRHVGNYKVSRKVFNIQRTIEKIVRQFNI